ncbi:MAG: ABC transporter permease, partial [Candidatus Hodarchaeales archaeon]
MSRNISINREKIIIISTPLVSILLAFIAGAILLFFLGFDPIITFIYLIFGTLTPTKIASTLFNTTPLILTGLSVAVAFRGGM